MKSASWLLDLLGPGLDLDHSALTRSLYAHDASNYRITPQVVVFPRNADEVAHVMRCATSTRTPVTARGAGSGMAGNSIGSGVVLDFRRHMHSLLAVDAEQGLVSAEPGLVLDELNRAVAAHGLMFGPDPSSHSRATIGGMLGNDACGNHSIAYGRTNQHVRALDLVLSDGTRVRATNHGLHALDAGDEQQVSALVAQLLTTVAAHAGPLRREFERCPRQVSGYALHHLLPERGFDVARALVGSEGSLAIIVGVTLALVPRPRDKQLMVLSYRNLIDAARDVPTLLSHSPAAIEAIDRDIVATMRARRGPASVPSLPDGEAWLYVEFEDAIALADLGLLASQVRALGHVVSVMQVHDAAQRQALWQVREEGAGLASNLISGARGRPGWEDTAVPPEALADYLMDLQEIQRQHGFAGVLYGHFGAGCVHIRFDFDLQSTQGRERMRAFLRDAAQAVAGHGGSISGEHGDGRARSELLPFMYSPELMQCFAEVKGIFDPEGVLNPGIIVDGPSVLADLPAAPVHLRTPFTLASDDGDLGMAAGRCVGIGKCVTANISSMCPSFQVTHQEVDSTRGRARVLQDALAGIEVSLEHAVKALDNCLSCKACSIDCPTGVDMATYKSAVLHRYYRGRRRPLTHYSLGRLPALLRTAARAPRMANALLGNRLLQRLLPLVGITSRRRLPRLATEPIAAVASARPGVAPRALLFVDTFTRSFRPQLVSAAIRVLDAAGIPVRLVEEGCCGLTWITTGQLETAQQVQRDLLRVLSGFDPSLPIVVLEPSCAASLAQDLPELLHEPAARLLAARVRTFAQILGELAQDWTWPALPAQVVLQTHCHERAAFASAPQRALLAQHGAAVDEAIGCCGLAGNFGFEHAHYELSVRIAEQSLLPTLDAAGPAAVMLADGFGCRCQIEDLRPGSEPLHLAELLDRALISSCR